MARLTPPRLESMRRFVHRYGPFGVFIARFITGLRFMAGPLAGSTGLPPRAFFIANVVGAGYAVAYGFGRSVRRIQRGASQVEQYLLLGALLVGVLYLGYRAWGRGGKQRGA